MTMRWSCHWVSLCILALGSVLPTVAEDSSKAKLFPSLKGNRPVLRLPVPMIGSSGVWGDMLVFRNYRIQKRADKENSYRLLNPFDIPEAEGSYEDCLKKLDNLRDEKGLKPLEGEVTLLIHGILRHSRSLGKVRTALEDAGHHPEPFDYPSTKVRLENAVEYLASTLRNFGPEVTRINIVVHSMGGLLVRTYLKTYGDQADPRIYRLVMMGTPNYGAQMATMLRDIGAFKMIFGPAGQQLVDADDAFVNELPTPPFEFAVIAGSRGNEKGWNPLIPGDDDGTVTVESTRLPGAKDFRTFVTSHALMLFRRDVADAAVRFIETGSLHEDGHCDPVPLLAAPPVM